MPLPPLLKILRLNWLRYQAARKTLPHLSDDESRQRFMEHVRRNLSWTRLAIPTDAANVIPLRIAELNGETIWCRSGLSDLGVVYDTFVGQYHLPPEDVQPVRTILDLGSNIGLTMAHLAARYPNATILGVELDRDNCELARRNVASFGDRCKVLHAGVWFEPGEVSYGGVRESGYAIGGGSGALTAPAVTVDQLIDRLGVEEVDYLKMDIEGAEREVLANGGRWLLRVRSIKVEVHAEKASSLYTMGNCINDLESNGIRCEVDARHHACVLGRRETK